MYWKQSFSHGNQIGVVVWMNAERRRRDQKWPKRQAQIKIVCADVQLRSSGSADEIFWMYKTGSRGLEMNWERDSWALESCEIEASRSSSLASKRTEQSDLMYLNRAGDPTKSVTGAGATAAVSWDILRREKQSRWTSEGQREFAALESGSQYGGAQTQKNYAWSSTRQVRLNRIAGLFQTTKKEKREISSNFETCFSVYWRAM